MFGIGGFELFLILLFGFLLFGPDKLPAMAKTLGKAIGKFRNAQEEMNKVIKNEVYDPDSDEPFKNPLDVMEKAADAGKKAANGASKAVNSATKAVASHSAPSKAASQQPRTVAKKESFSERNARYARERAAKQAADAEKAEAAKWAALAAADAKSAEAATPAAAPAAAPAASASAATQSASTETKGE